MLGGREQKAVGWWGAESLCRECSTGWKGMFHFFTISHAEQMCTKLRQQTKIKFVLL